MDAAPCWRAMALCWSSSAADNCKWRAMTLCWSRSMQKGATCTDSCTRMVAGGAVCVSVCVCVRASVNDMQPYRAQRAAGCGDGAGTLPAGHALLAHPGHHAQGHQA
eukprot:1144851-Pelagomonas_calceolata.AAC.5